jgi:hypothetical protein
MEVDEKKVVHYAQRIGLMYPKFVVNSCINTNSVFISQTKLLDLLLRLRKEKLLIFIPNRYFNYLFIQFNENFGVRNKTIFVEKYNRIIDIQTPNKLFICLDDPYRFLVEFIKFTQTNKPSFAYRERVRYVDERKVLWNMYFGKIFKKQPDGTFKLEEQVARCFQCKKIITFKNFRMGHDRSRVKNPEFKYLDDLCNIFPFCKECDEKMGIANATDYGMWLCSIQSC